MRPIASGVRLSIEMIPVSTVSGDDAAALRRKAFVEAARKGFLANGYAGTTMSSIASAVGGSKTTLWTYFPSKEALFEAVVDDIVDYYGAALQVERSEARRGGQECVSTCWSRG